MGMSADAILCFGVDCGEERPIPGDELELGKYLAEKEGLVDPWPEYYNNGEYGNPEAEKRLDHYRKHVRDLEHKAPVVIIHYGYWDGYACYILALKNSVKQSSEYGCESIKISEPTLEERKEAIIFCNEHGLPAFNASWLLAASYG